MIRDIRVLYAREIRSALRERSIVVNGILIPVFLYPVMLWAIFSVLLFVEGQTEGFTSRVAVVGDANGGRLTDELSASDGLSLVEVAGEREARNLLLRGELDAVVRVASPGTGGAALEGNAAYVVLYDRSEDRSRLALSRVRTVVDSLRTERLTGEARGLGLDPERLEAFQVSRENVASDRDRGVMILSVVVPIFLTLMVALGCFIPAVDTTAGERERSTWETLWSTGASRRDVVLAKYLFVATMGIVAGVLNVVAMSASLGGVLQPLLGEEAADLAFAVPLEAIPLMLAVAVLLALLFAAAMMVLGVFARSFKEGQAMVTPAYWLAMAPLVMGSSPDSTLTPGLALVPVANVSMAVRDALQRRVDPDLVIMAFAVNALLVLGCLFLARRLLEREDVITGSFEGSLWTWMRERWSGT